jgi:hypothetical protein
MWSVFLIGYHNYWSRWFAISSSSHPFALPAHILSTAGDAEYVTLQRYVSHYVLFCHLTRKTKIGTANGCGIINSKPPGRIIMMGQSETLKSYLLRKMCTAQRCFGFHQLTRSQIILIITLFLAANFEIMLSQNHFPKPNPHILTFLLQFYRAGSHTKHRWRCPYRHKPA